MPPTAVTSVKRFHINHCASATRALICLMTFTFDLLILKLVRIIASGMGNFQTILVYETFRFELMGQHLSDAPRDIVTLTFDLVGHGTYIYIYIYISYFSRKLSDGSRAI